MSPQPSDVRVGDEPYKSMAKGKEHQAAQPETVELPYLGDGQIKGTSSDVQPVHEILENKWAIAGMIIPFSIAGVLIRVAVLRLQTYEGAPVFSLVYTQWIGCFIMGIVVQNKTTLLLWYHPLQAGIASGLCGSITTFSSWQLDIFEAFANYNAASHTRGKNILAALSQLVVTFAMSLNGLLFGHHIGRYLGHIRRKDKSLDPKTTLKTCGFSMRYLQPRDRVVIGFGLLCWIGVILAAAFTQSQRGLALACVFAPCGALLRWYLSAFNTLRGGHFPLGTFAANIGGTIVLAVLALIRSGVPVAPLACDVIIGLVDGFCGCLTTVSTFLVELSSLSFRRSYIYGVISTVAAQCCMFIILGPYIWTHGVHPTCT